MTRIWYANDVADCGTPWRIQGPDGVTHLAAWFRVTGDVWGAFDPAGFDDLLQRPRGILVTDGTVTHGPAEPRKDPDAP